MSGMTPDVNRSVVSEWFVVLRNISKSRPELPALALFFVAYLIFQIHAAVLHGYWGQDIATHKKWITLAAHDPLEYIRTYGEGRTNPPLYHLIAGFVRRAVGLPDYRYLLAIGLMNVLFSLFGLVALYALVRRLIASPLLRLAVMVFVMFLPFAMIHAEVIASDALATPLFLGFVWAVIALPERRSRLAFALSVVLTSLLLVAGILTKFTFGSVLVASAFCLTLLWWTGTLVARRVAAALIVIPLLSGALGYSEMRRFTSQQKYNLGLRSLHSAGALLEAPMNPRSILFLRRADTEVLAAPPYDWVRSGIYLLLSNNEHSFPALLHLAMFTDILNIYQFEPYNKVFGRRTVSNHHRMQIAVRLGILFHFSLWWVSL